MVEWSCETCTFLNSPGVPVCEMCETPKPLKLAEVQPSAPHCHTSGCIQPSQGQCDTCHKSHCASCSPLHKCKDEQTEAKVAPATLARDSSVNAVEDFECRVCQELMVDPCTLHCGHTCCRHCLFKWLKASKGDAKCPAGCATAIPRSLPKVSIVLRTQLQKEFPKEYEQRLAAVDAALGDDRDEYKKMDSDSPVQSTAQSDDNPLRFLEAFMGLQRRVAESRHCSHCRGEAGLCACKSGCSLKPTSACIAVHDFACDGCRVAPVTGKLYLCSKCDNYGLCGTCYGDLTHNLDHEFLQLDIRGAPPKRLAARQAYPASIEVVGAGSEEANGQYFKTTELMAGTPKYRMERPEAGFTKVYHICKSRSTRTQTIKWWICRTDQAGDRIGAAKDIDFYTCEMDSMLPPLSGWQCLHGVAPVPTLVFPPDSGEAKQPGVGRLQIGDSVMLSDTYLSCSDAASGPLQPGQVGIIWNDAHDIKPYQLEIDGQRCKWWYSEGALQRPTAPWSEEKVAEAKNAADYRKKLSFVDQVLQDDDIPEHAKQLLVDEILNLPPGQTSPMFSLTELGFQIHMGAVLRKVPEERHTFLLKRIRQDADFSEEEKAFLCEDVTSGRHEAVQDKADGWTINRAALQKIMRERGLPIGRTVAIVHCEHCAGHHAECSCRQSCEKPAGAACYPRSSSQPFPLLSQLLPSILETPASEVLPSLNSPSADPNDLSAELEEDEEDEEELLREIEGDEEEEEEECPTKDISELKTWSISQLKTHLRKAIAGCSDPRLLQCAVWGWECAAADPSRLAALAQMAKVDPEQPAPLLRERLRATFPAEESKTQAADNPESLGLAELD